MKFISTLLLLAILGLAVSARKCGVKPKPCYIGGCSGQLCTAQKGAVSTCEWKEEYACYASATCERQANGKCGWTQTDELKQCIEDARDNSGPCYVGGCSSQLCTDQEGAVSTCEWTEAYACYRDATCERQSNGQCGWTQTDELQECLDNAS